MNVASPPRHEPRRPRNDPAQYDDLADEWWRPHGRLAALRWLAQARGRLIPDPPHPGAALLDLACGAGLLSVALTGRLAGWRHVGVDLSAPALRQAAGHGVTAIRADVHRLPFPDGQFSCVVAGELFEHLVDLDGACAAIGRVLAPGGTLVIDTLANTLFCRLALVRIAEHLPGGPPPRVHDPKLLVAPDRLARALERAGIEMTLVGGLRPSLVDYARWLARRADSVRMLPTGSTAGVYQALGVRATNGRGGR
ncbi:methyltransferase domain-containing protein [Frankia sp. Ag45/Mut15]|uniref:Methyltransferase domain-containing protein n=1 Tax=Frankia umida TaxID=573489 RepID=A0ABT0JT99_9ACTN|nr:class I SAM-dependent methyltransferase [Frankia umida]MCK9874600.1 methyltransferase domain-containing protein [Frankia umida]